MTLLYDIGEGQLGWQFAIVDADGYTVHQNHQIFSSQIGATHAARLKLAELRRALN